MALILLFICAGGYLAMLMWLREPTRGVFDMNYMFLSKGEILDSFEHCFKNFVIDQDLQDLYKQFFDFFYSPPPLGENRSLGLVQAIEGFHRAAVLKCI